MYAVLLYIHCCGSRFKDAMVTIVISLEKWTKCIVMPVIFIK